LIAGNCEKGTLFIFSGLPGSGKSTISKLLSKRLSALYLRVDTVEHMLSEYVQGDIEDKGYRILYRLAYDNLSLGLKVVADSCNPIVITRNDWEKVAINSNSKYVNIEVVCSNPEEHRNRIEKRVSDIDGFMLPTWNQVVNREYQVWNKERIEIDTALKSEQESIEELIYKINMLNLKKYLERFYSMTKN
jgi:predicted kinase